MGEIDTTSVGRSPEHGSTSLTLTYNIDRNGLSQVWSIVAYFDTVTDECACKFRPSIHLRLEEPL